MVGGKSRIERSGTRHQLGKESQLQGRIAQMEALGHSKLPELLSDLVYLKIVIGRMGVRCQSSEVEW